MVSTPMPTKALSAGVSINEVHVYPNPSNDFFNVVLTEDIKQGVFEIFGLNGQLVEKGEFSGASLNLGHDLKEGIYFVTILDGNSFYAKERIVKIN
jgi:hypothetical protein